MKKRLVILGAGESGVGAALLAKMHGYDVFVSDMGQIKEEYLNELNNASIAFELGKHTVDLIINADEVVKSPGIPDKAPVIVQLKNKKIPVISEIEFASRYTSAKKICITGSNGKTTTTLLIYDIFKEAGLNVGLAGNVGTSLARQLACGNDFDYLVVELSSFQLDGMFEFKAEVAILMNITPDHLDRYDYKMQNYVDSKFRILQNQTADDYFIYCSDDLIIKEEILKLDVVAKQLPFSLEVEVEQGAYGKEKQIHLTLNTNIMSIFYHELALQGRHNIYNSMAASIAASVAHINKEVIRQCLASFKGVEHRLERVLSVRGMEFINDSKATNVNSTWYALECMQTPVIWLAGGTDKGNDYASLFDLVTEKVKVLICIGVDNKKLIASFGGMVPTILEAESMEEAVKLAYKSGMKGDSVLLSPACASFDRFKNYEDRGRQFKECVRNL
ncbi:MAG: UDP-N-acetylmuramoyl-L-alanine--D-glutamate ligase [Marinilabiliaceae bacterium]|nr:UDP-N-acetylmuramoyl-L-alanine--D-glutamate ligase [Marinilabiliaceae bacterium]